MASMNRPSRKRRNRSPSSRTDRMWTIIRGAGSEAPGEPAEQGERQADLLAVGEDHVVAVAFAEGRPRRGARGRRRPSRSACPSARLRRRASATSRTSASISRASSR